jgi:hypothetical protein
MPAGERRTKDQEMAQRLKREGDERRQGRCCICYRVVPLALMYTHLGYSCTGPAKHTGSAGHSVFAFRSA